MHAKNENLLCCVFRHKIESFSPSFLLVVARKKKQKGNGGSYELGWAFFIRPNLSEFRLNSTEMVLRSANFNENFQQRQILIALPMKRANRTGQDG